MSKEKIYKSDEDSIPKVFFFLFLLLLFIAVVVIIIISAF
jgi:hypothetical protein